MASGPRDRPAPDLEKDVARLNADRRAGPAGDDAGDSGALGILLYSDAEPDSGLCLRGDGLSLLRVRDGRDGQRERRGAGNGSRTDFS
jgi:hypothetical protein